MYAKLLANVRLATVLFLCVPFLSAQGQDKAKAKNPPAKNAPAAVPANSPIMMELNAWFTRWDRNKDTHLDKRELANAFNYAYPFDYDPLRPAASTTPKESSESTEAAKPAKAAAGNSSKYANRNDYQFLKSVDKDDDERVSKPEFDGYAREYAAEYMEMQRELEQVRREIAQAQQAQRERLQQRQRDLQRRIDQRDRDRRNRRR